MNTKVTYVSVDVEADGPCPGLNSMLSLGAQSWDEESNKEQDFYVVLERLENTTPDESTTIFWERHKDAYKAATTNPVNPNLAMQWFHSWLSNLPNRPLFVGYPAPFDFNWTFYYLNRFVGSCIFGWSALDIKTYAMAQLDIPFVKSQKKYWPKEWFEGLSKHNHNALDDAKEQMILFKRIYNSRIRLHG